MARESRVRGEAGSVAPGEDGLDSFDDEADLAVVVVAIPCCAEVPGVGDAMACGFIGQVAADFRGELVEGGEEDCFFVFLEALQVSGGAFGEQETAATGDLEAFVD